MTIFDLYLLRKFLMIFVICFVSLSGLYVVIHLFTNLEEMLQLSKDQGSLIEAFTAYYGPRVLDFFNQMAAMIALISAIFTFTILQKAHEITAMEAAGLSKSRIVRPLVVASTIVVVGVVVCREGLIPRFRDQLSQNAQDQTGDKLHPVRPFTDFETQVTVRSGKTCLRDASIASPHFYLKGGKQRLETSIVAEHAVFTETEIGLVGYLVSQVSVPGNLSKRNSVSVKDKQVILFPGDTDWLKEDQCFVAMNVPPSRLVMGPDTARYASLSELIQSNLHPSVHFTNRQRVEVHRRIVQPFLDLSLIALGLPLVIARRDRNVFFAAGICMAAVTLIFLVTMTFHGLGASRIVSPPALAAWLPLMIFSPLAVVAMSRLNK